MMCEWIERKARRLARLAPQASPRESDAKAGADAGHGGVRAVATLNLPLY